MVYVPVVAATRLECYVEGRYLLSCQRCKIALTDEVLSVCVVLLSKREYIGKSVGSRTIAAFVYLPDYGECAPCLRPAAVECKLRYNFNYLLLCDAVLLAVGYVITELLVLSC